MTPRGVERRLRIAVDANIGWYEDLFALHGVPSTLRGGLWSGASSVPLHSDAVVVEPEVTAAEVRARLDGREHAAFKDSFSTLDGAALGMDLLFEAVWTYRDTVDAAATEPEPGGWSVVAGPHELAEWTSGHDTADVLLPGLLDRARFKILAKRAGGPILAGAVARLGSGAVDVSNVHAAPGHRVDWAELARAIGTLFPGRPLVGYERGDDLAAALEGGWQPVGTLRVWVR